MKKTIQILAYVSILLVLLVVIILLLFPIKYSGYVEKYSREYGLDANMVYSVINIESGFDERAVSRSGARGLMQIMPSTASEIADKLDIKDFSIDRLFEPEINIKFGCYYLRYLLDIFDENIDNALASYNWGITNVKNWINSGNSDNGTIANIPIDETRSYIGKYRVNRFIYDLGL